MVKTLKEFKNCLEVLRYLQDHKNDDDPNTRRVYIEEKRQFDYICHYLVYNPETDYVEEVTEYNQSLSLDYINKIINKMNKIKKK